MKQNKTETKDILFPLAIGIVSSLIGGFFLRSVLMGTIAFGIATILSFLIKSGIERWKRMRQSTYPEIKRRYASQKESEEDIVDLIRASRKIDILTIRGLGVIGLNDSLLRKPILASGDIPKQIRVFMLSPESVYVEGRARETNERTESFRDGVSLGIEKVRELRDISPHETRIYLYDRLPCWRAIRIDEWIFLSAFAGTTEGHQSEVYKINSAENGILGNSLMLYMDSLVQETEELK
jgi:hypothetical protein